MKILVPTKRVPDTDQRLHVADNGANIEVGDIPFVMNPFDAIALEEAVRLREGPISAAEVIAIGIGEEAYEQELRTALAVGADRAIHIACDTTLDPWNVALVLEAVVQQEQPGLVLMGKQAVDDDASQVGPFLAARLGWPQATFASRIELVDNGLRVARETDLGIETVKITLPAVVTADLRLNEPRYASLPSILKARKKTIEQIPLTSLDFTIEPRLSIVSMEAINAQRTCSFVNSVDELIAKCRDEAGVL